MKKIISERKIIITIGKKTDTIKICTKDNTTGDYEKSFRISGGYRLSIDELDRKLSEFTDLGSLERYLIDDRKAKDEYQKNYSGTIPDDPSKYNPDNDTWLPRAIKRIELIINQVIEDFIKSPYLHRCEHSFHAYFWEKLKNDTELYSCIKIEGEDTQNIHKEWPETRRRTKKRGNFDIDILSPEQLKSCPSIKDYLEGNLHAPIVFEIGLDYNNHHLEQDLKKIKQNRPKYGYLIHFGRYKPIEDISSICNDAKVNNIKVAYAWINGKKSLYKKINNDEIIPQDR